MWRFYRILIVFFRHSAMFVRRRVYLYFIFFVYNYRYEKLFSFDLPSKFNYFFNFSPADLELFYLQDSFHFSKLIHDFIYICLNKYIFIKFIMTSIITQYFISYSITWIIILWSLLPLCHIYQSSVWNTF